MELTVKNLVARHHLSRKWQPHTYVECKDKNPDNCNVKNLRLYTQSLHGKRTAPANKNKAVIVEGRKYKSVREAAKNNFVSYQTMLDYLTPGKVKKSVLEGTETRYVKTRKGINNVEIEQRQP